MAKRRKAVLHAATLMLLAATLLRVLGFTCHHACCVNLN